MSLRMTIKISVQDHAGDGNLHECEIACDPSTKGALTQILRCVRSAILAMVDPA